MTWNLAEAKNRLTEGVNLALTEGPQTITRRNDTVVVLSAAEYAELTGKRPGFKEYLTQGASFEGLNLDRDASPGRDVELRSPSSTPTPWPRSAKPAAILW